MDWLPLITLARGTRVIRFFCANAICIAIVSRFRFKASMQIMRDSSSLGIMIEAHN
jgi:hypothetical protein